MSQSMIGYANAVKRAFRDQLRFTPTGGTDEDPIFSGIPSGCYAMQIEGRYDYVRINGSSMSFLMDRKPHDETILNPISGYDFEAIKFNGSYYSHPKTNSYDTKEKVLQELREWKEPDYSNSECIPVSNNTEEENFLLSVLEERKRFTQKSSGDWWMRIGVDRVVFENILIMYDQMAKRLRDHQLKTKQ